MFIPFLKLTQTRKTTLTLTLTATLIITGCATTNQAATTAQNNLANGLYTFPTKLYNDYWAMDEKIGNDAIVVNFNGDTSEIYRFKCSPNGTYQQIH